MHVLVATDGSRQSHDAAKFLRKTVDPKTVTKVSVVAVVSPLAAVPFVTDDEDSGINEMSFRASAEKAVLSVAAELTDWGPPVSTHVYGGSPAGEILKAATRFSSGLIVMASSSTRTQAALMGSVANKVVLQANAPVLVHRPAARKKAAKKK
ncbi:universal stress protein [Aeromicrobium alkaliterrae]|uniref:UspA domain-containing protein n=1 Tax=Aeromicrobium alkaliterrae TaxID=302168 RepID=A0ABN2JXN4_9ACTN